VIMLYFWTQDEDQIRRIHGNSSLSRAKSQHRLDYLDRSIQVAANSGMETYDWSRSRSHSLGTTGMRNDSLQSLYGAQHLLMLSYGGADSPESRAIPQPRYGGGSPTKERSRFAYRDYLSPARTISCGQHVEVVFYPRPICAFSQPP
jgi:hypothetical protein